VFDWIFEILFKYPRWIYGQGEFRFGASSATLLVAAAVAACAAATLVTYRTARRARGRDRAVLVGLRLVALAAILVALARPVLVVRASVPQQNFVGVLLDDSRSMRISDGDGGAPRSAAVGRAFGTPQSPLLQALSDRYLVRLFRFSSTADRVQNGSELTFAGTASRVGEGLRRARDELAGLPLAGLVVVTDGADTTGDSLADTLLALKADAVPVFTVGVGRDTLARDIQISRIVTPRAVLKGTSLVVDVTVAHRGFAGAKLPVNVESDGRILGSEEVTLPADGEPATVRLRFTADMPGAHVFRFRVPPQSGEAIAENNARDALMEVEDRREKILYFEGEPRFEVKFIRRAVEEDQNLQVTVLQRTAENKYYRLHVDHPEELVSGFPRTRDELFGYRGLILGSIEAAAFTGDQLRMIADFVDRRGGGLLMLGGRRAFAEGGYAGTPVAEALPVVLEGRQPEQSPPVRVAIKPTRAGVTHPVTQVAKTERESESRWGTLPQLTSLNPIHAVKPGATVLLTGQDGSRADRVVLAHQRYGRGTAMALAVQDSWLWQMHAEVPVEDTTHEMLWRQLLRWLVAEVPDRVSLTTSADRVERGETVTLVASVSDPTFMQVNTAEVMATVTAPSGAAVEVPMQWTGERDGEYRATFVPDQEGTYEARVAANVHGTALGADTTVFRAAPGDAEFFDAAMRAPLLRRVAEETGGRFYTESTMSRLPDDLKYSGRGVTVVEERELWDMPALLLLLVACVLGEWSYRRARGLA
jgi:uncharacterized membrane protein